MLGHYLVLWVCMLIRFLTDLLLGYRNFVTHSEGEPTCGIEAGKMGEVDAAGTVFLLTDVVLTHYLAIFVVLRIYRIDNG